MTEAEWLAATDPAPMLDFLRGKASDRKLRLFAVACGRTIWPYINGACREAIRVTELYADELASHQEFTDIREAFRATEADSSVIILGGRRYLPRFGVCLIFEDAIKVALGAAGSSSHQAAVHALGGFGRDFTDTQLKDGLRVEKAARKSLLCEIVGPLPFRQIAFSPAWRTSTVLALAEGIYSDQAFGRLPILADALMDAGCDADDILAHCRADGPHARGCWVVDLVLGKE